MSLTDSAEEFINNNHEGMLAIQSAVFFGEFKLIDGEHQRVQIENCKCFCGGIEFQLQKVTVQYKDIIAWVLDKNLRECSNVIKL